MLSHHHAMTVIANFFYILVALGSLGLYFLRRHLNYWNRRGIPHDKPDIVEGSMKGSRRTRHPQRIYQDYYEKYKGTGPFAGFFYFLKPAILVTDLDLIKNILIKDYHNFIDRNFYCNEVHDPLSANLINLDGEKWKFIRGKITPAFTSGRLKLMFPLVMQVGQELVSTVDDNIANNSVLEVKDIIARFTIDVIGTCAFGLDCNSLRHPDVEFRTLGQKAVTQLHHGQLMEGLIFSFQNLSRKLGVRVIPEDVNNFYMRVVRETVEFREKNSIKRNDFMDLMIETKNSEGGITMNELTAQAYVFFLAGYETSSTTMSFALFELANNQGIQDNLRAEINAAIEKNGGELTFEGLFGMQYMDKVIKETLRKYSVSPLLLRGVSSDYRTSDPTYTIPKGVMIIIPVDAIHRDPQIYPDPEKFDPERFAPEETARRHPMTWLPFGDGPRNCVAARFGKMEVFLGLSILLRNFRFFVTDKSPYPLETDITASLLSPKGGVYLRVERI